MSDVAFFPFRDKQNVFHPFKYIADSFSLQSKLLLDHNKLESGFFYAEKNLDYFSSGFLKSEDDKIILSNPKLVTEKQVLIKVEKQKIITIAFGSEFELSVVDELFNILKIIEDEFKFSSQHFEWIDYQLRLFSDIPCNHYNVINEAFYKNSQLSNLFQPEISILRNDVYLRGHVDESRIAKITVTSNVTDKEVRSGIFENDELRIIASIGLIELLYDKSLIDLYKEHLTACSKYIKDILYQNVILPLITELKNISTI